MLRDDGIKKEGLTTPDVERSLIVLTPPEHL
jgi:hypothetical protein